MNDYDEKGWAPIHHAVYRGFVKSVERFVKAGAEQVELLTRDELKCSPFLVACIAGNLETVTLMISLNCNLSATDTQSHGAVEISALRQHINLLEYFSSLNSGSLPVLKNLVQMVQSSEEEVFAGVKCLRILTQKSRGDSTDTVNTLLDPSYRLISILYSVLNDLSSGNVDRCDAIASELSELLFNLFDHTPSLVNDCEQSGYLLLVQRFFKTDVLKSRTVQANMVKLLTIFVRTHDQADAVLRQGVLTTVLRMLQANDTELSADKLLLESLQLLSILAAFGSEMQTEICRDTDLVRYLVQVYRSSRQKDTILTLTRTFCALIKAHKANQSLLLQLGIADAVLDCLRLKSIDVQTSAVDALQLLCSDNSEVQQLFKRKNVYVFLLALLKRCRQPAVHKQILHTFWLLAASDLNEQQLVAKLVGVLPLYGYLSSQDEQLRLVSMQMLTALAQAPICTRHEVANLTGVQTLVGLLESENRQLLVQTLRTLRQLSVGVAFVANRTVQEAVARARGTMQLLAIMQRSVQTDDRCLYLEAACTLSALCLNNRPIMTQVRSVADFSFAKVLQLLNESDLDTSESECEVRYLAGCTLATFLYGSLREQAIASVQASVGENPVRFRSFVPALKSNDAHRRIEAAFQIVVLSKVITDELFTITSATGVKILSDILELSLRQADEAVVFHALEVIARLLRLRSTGVADAFVTVGIVDLLAKLLLPDSVNSSSRRDPCAADLLGIFTSSERSLFSENVRGAASVALVFLSYLSEGRNRIMTYCRRFPQLIALVSHYVRPVLAFSKAFQEQWHLFESQLLPSVKKQSRVNVVSVNPVDAALERVKELSYMSLSKEDALAKEDTYVSLAANTQRRASLFNQRTLLPLASSMSTDLMPERIAEESVTQASHG